MSHQSKDEQLIALRPIVDIEFTGSKTPDEAFMHNTLRPILKFQHEKIVRMIESTPHFENQQFNSNSENNLAIIKQFIQKNNALKMQLIGSIIGMMTVEELEYTLSNFSPIKKRIADMVVVRYISTMSN